MICSWNSEKTMKEGFSLSCGRDQRVKEEIGTFRKSSIRGMNSKFHITHASPFFVNQRQRIEFLSHVCTLRLTRGPKTFWWMSICLTIWQSKAHDKDCIIRECRSHKLEVARNFLFKRRYIFKSRIFFSEKGNYADTEAPIFRDTWHSRFSEEVLYF